MTGIGAHNVRRSRAVGALAVVASIAYWVSDAWETATGGFTDAQLLLTLVAEAAVPVFVVALIWIRRDRWGRWWRPSAVAAAGYGLAYLYFTGTVVHAMRTDTVDFAALADDLEPWMTLAGAVMVVSGVVLGLAVARSATYPRWTGCCLVIGVVLVAITTSAPAALSLVAVGLRDLAWIGMGSALAMAPTAPAATGRVEMATTARTT